MNVTSSPRLKVSRSSSRTRTSTRCPARCLPTEKTWFETEMVPLSETVRLIQPKAALSDLKTAGRVVPTALTDYHHNLALPVLIDRQAPITSVLFVVGLTNETAEARNGHAHTRAMPRREELARSDATAVGREGGGGTEHFTGL